MTPHEIVTGATGAIRRAAGRGGFLPWDVAVVVSVEEAY
jgi:hypothetical protein